MKFLDMHAEEVFGFLSELDRISFRGTIRWLANSRGMGAFLCGMHVLLKNFDNYVEGVTKEVRDSCAAAAAQLGISTVYLNSSSVDKEKEARRIASERKVSETPICLFRVVEPCVSPTVVGKKASKMLELTMKPRKCVWVYYYFDLPEYGFWHVRLQTWFPFNNKTLKNRLRRVN